MRITDAITNNPPFLKLKKQKLSSLEQLARARDLADSPCPPLYYYGLKLGSNTTNLEELNKIFTKEGFRQKKTNSEIRYFWKANSVVDFCQVEYVCVDFKTSQIFKYGMCFNGLGHHYSNDKWLKLAMYLFNIPKSPDWELSSIVCGGEKRYVKNIGTWQYVVLIEKNSHFVYCFVVDKNKLTIDVKAEISDNVRSDKNLKTVPQDSNAQFSVEDWMQNRYRLNSKNLYKLAPFERIKYKQRSTLEELNLAKVLAHSPCPNLCYYGVYIELPVQPIKKLDKIFKEAGFKKEQNKQSISYTWNGEFDTNGFSSEFIHVDKISHALTYRLSLSLLDKPKSSKFWETVAENMFNIPRKPMWTVEEEGDDGEIILSKYVGRWNYTIVLDFDFEEVYFEVSEKNISSNLDEI